MASHSKPWWKWLSNTELRILRFEKSRKLKRNSLELAKARTLERKVSKSILKKTSVDTLSACPRIASDASIQKEVYLNKGFEESEAQIRDNHTSDYEYSGYTLEITDIVRIIPISEISKKDETFWPIRRLSDEIVNKKLNRKVSFVK